MPLVANFLQSLLVKNIKIGQYLVKIWSKCNSLLFWATLYIIHTTLFAVTSLWIRDDDKVHFSKTCNVFIIRLYVARRHTYLCCCESLNGIILSLENNAPTTEVVTRAMHTCRSGHAMGDFWHLKCMAYELFTL